MKTMKRVCALLMAMAISLSLAACGNKATDTIADDTVSDHVEQTTGNTAKENGTKTDNAQKADDKTEAKTGTTAGDSKTDTAKTDAQKPASSSKQDTTKAETKADNSKTDSKADSKTDSKTEPQKPTIGKSDSAGSASKPSGSGTSTTPSTPSSGNSGSSGSNSGSSSGSFVENPEPDISGTTGDIARPTGKADIDCAEAMRVGNEYALSIGFTDVWDGCASYMTPVYFELDYPSSQWTQEKMNSVMKEMVDAVKRVSDKNGRWTPELEGWAAGINCVVRWNEAEGCHEMYAYFAA